MTWRIERHGRSPLPGALRRLTALFPVPARFRPDAARSLAAARDEVTALARAGARV